jgi:hypothetical protein
MDRLPYIRTWLSTSNRPAHGAALALIGVQVSIGIVMKSSQTGGHYAFSTSGCITISEFLKLLLSSGFFWIECHRREKNSWQNTGSLGEFQPLANIAEPHSSSDCSCSTDLILDLEKDEENLEWSPINEMSGSRRWFGNFGKLWETITSEVSLEARYGFAILSSFYALINNTVSTLCSL